MKRKDLERKLTKAGWYLLRHGGKHDVWTNGTATTTIPRGKEIKEGTAKQILKTAGLN